ncbi:GNAT family N-acetyltransferase [Sphingomonas sp. BT-65]|uniref:GNAT family N-acetyltransferase n=1 Tax=Sphingomonas sp. BT-65 TaxID=2989821 RepID=UPI002235BA50|nr:GNAT family N-acetyltransferase [Sphingomonas sp. BT-65]MCW4462169.1 GNAT family N-acetyltransferase [Sphingomonas sp. BT-65]
MNDALLFGWLAARSIARGLPAPVADHDGFRVDTGGEVEICRWAFTRPCTGLTELGHALDAPGYFLKLCGNGADLLAPLPPRWRLQDLGYCMQGPETPPPASALPAGYTLQFDRDARGSRVAILAPDGALAASGTAAEAGGVFVYDRIITEPNHRRRGLGRVVMAALHETRADRAATELLVATDEGRALYTALGWTVLSPFVTAEIPSA